MDRKIKTGIKTYLCVTYFHLEWVIHIHPFIFMSLWYLDNIVWECTNTGENKVVEKTLFLITPRNSFNNLNNSYHLLYGYCVHCALYLIDFVSSSLKNAEPRFREVKSLTDAQPMGVEAGSKLSSAIPQASLFPLMIILIFQEEDNVA